MIYEMTIQVRVPDMDKGQRWYETLLCKKPDFVPHEGFAEWELLPCCWLQVAEGEPAAGSGPLRLGVEDIEAEKTRLLSSLGIEDFPVHSRSEVPVKWGTFDDPWGNRIGLFQYIDQEEIQKRIVSRVRRHIQ
ncbi:VOC family protein [Rossellomorea aquimaris]|uniref:VOC family protein n=1 Tax=Rossellomorea aquimaris TaxID=189382 RepID=UPI001CD31116|nr:VOC family protein [Rossellomorea aquimaris]MCA1053799.1 VOC family protein [Rossellomorea aquimaris]